MSSIQSKISQYIKNQENVIDSQKATNVNTEIQMLDFKAAAITITI